YLSKLN
ncbi:hypothetical protein DERP_009153, partial [Dermatophagoides pteronyssinus]